jgi:hypothetical protein
LWWRITSLLSFFVGVIMLNVTLTNPLVMLGHVVAIDWNKLVYMMHFLLSLSNV